MVEHKFELRDFYSIVSNSLFLRKHAICKAYEDRKTSYKSAEKVIFDIDNAYDVLEYPQVEKAIQEAIKEKNNGR